MIDHLSDQQQEEYRCPYCQRVVPKLTLHIAGKMRIMQPICECEARQDEENRIEAIHHKQKGEIERKYSALGSSKYGEYTLEQFLPRRGTAKAIEECQQFIDGFDSNDGHILYLYGGTGAGKSHLAAAIGNQLRTKYIVVYLSIVEILEQIRGSFSSQEQEQRIMQGLVSCDLLIIDDLGVERPSDWSMDVIHRIIDRRVNQRKGIIITSNYDILQLKQRYTLIQRGGITNAIPGERIISRIAQGGNHLVHNQAQDYRLEQAMKQKMSMQLNQNI